MMRSILCPLVVFTASAVHAPSTQDDDALATDEGFDNWEEEDSAALAEGVEDEDAGADSDPEGDADAEEIENMIEEDEDSDSVDDDAENDGDDDEDNDESVVEDDEETDDDDDDDAAEDEAGLGETSATENAGSEEAAEADLQAIEAEEADLQAIAEAEALVVESAKGGGDPEAHEDEFDEIANEAADDAAAELGHETDEGEFDEIATEAADDATAEFGHETAQVGSAISMLETEEHDYVYPSDDPSSPSILASIMEDAREVMASASSEDRVGAALHAFQVEAERLGHKELTTDLMEEEDEPIEKKRASAMADFSFHQDTLASFDKDMNSNWHIGGEVASLGAEAEAEVSAPSEESDEPSPPNAIDELLKSIRGDLGTSSQ